MELRHTRRLVRYWVFLSIAWLFGLGAYIYYSGLHTVFSSFSASVGMIGPRYLMGAIGSYYITGFVLCIVFLGFDVRARDIRESIVEVLDSRPLTNLELVAGRFVALFLAAWIPMIAIVLFIQGLGWLLPQLGAAFGRTVEPVSLFSFVLLMGLPAIVFAISLVFLVTLLVRNRIVAAVVSVAAIIGLYAALFTVPATYGSLIDFFGAMSVSFPSDLVPALALEGGWLQRIGYLAVGIGLLGLAAAIHPRLDGGEQWRPAAGGAAFVVIGVALLGLVSLQRLGDVADVERWRAAHEARATEPVVDIVSIDGTLAIDPGDRIDAALTLEVQAPPEQPLARVLLSLNPGVEVESVSGADGAALTAVHADGLLDIELARPLGPGQRTTLALRYGGLPNTDFAYLDSAIELGTLNLNEAQIGLLGFRPGIFESRFVALTPGIRWLPASGVDVGRDDPRTRRTDYFRLALDVEAPSDWLVGGPGRRERVGTDGNRATFRFAPAAVVPEAALVASRFESFATEIDGITFEVLVDPAHDANFEVLADARGVIEEWVADHLEVARSVGLEYPFDGFTIVEVPNSLRSYVGGWRLDTALAPPGMMLLKETSFPTARFDYDVLNSVFININTDRSEDDDPTEALRDRVVNFFSNDFAGGNVFTGAARSFFAHRTSAYGPEAIALDFALEELATLLISGQRSYFSVHLFSNVNAAATSIIAGIQGQQVSSISDALITVQTGRTEVWEAALDARLADMDPWDDPQRTIDVLTLKGGQMAEAIYDTLGPDAVGRMLAYLVERYDGTSFTLDELMAAGDVAGEGLGELFYDWFGGTGLPGFTSDGAELYRLPDSESGDSRYQLLINIRNDEPVTGFTRAAWSMQATGRRTTSDPIRVPGNSAVDFGVVLSEPPAAAFVHPYLSLNRDDFLVRTFNTGEIRTRDAEPLSGVRDVALASAREDDRIIADDLDESFAIISDEGDDDLRLAVRQTAIAGMDRGLPVATGAVVPTRWSRRNVDSAFGRYRHTLAYMGPGDGSTRAVLPVTLPAAGTWELELYQPFLQYVQPQNRGIWNLEIVSEYGREAVAYDATVGATGWNLVGQYDLPAGEVRVEISDQTNGALIVADAVAWSPVGIRGLTRAGANAEAAAEGNANTDGSDSE